MSQRIPAYRNAERAGPERATGGRRPGGWTDGWTRAAARAGSYRAAVERRRDDTCCSVLAQTEAYRRVSARIAHSRRSFFNKNARAISRYEAATQAYRHVFLVIPATAYYGKYGNLHKYSFRSVLTTFLRIEESTYYVKSFSFFT